MLNKENNEMLQRLRMKKKSKEESWFRSCREEGAPPERRESLTPEPITLQHSQGQPRTLTVRESQSMPHLT